jgi:glycosyltransferase involved in cell wall biosynthesis
MRKVAIISINGTANVGGVERVVANHVRILSELAKVRVFSLPPLRNLRRFRILNFLLMAGYPWVSSLFARVWAGSRGVVISHGYSSIGISCDVVFAHGCWAGYVKGTNTRLGIFGRVIYVVESLAARFGRKVVGVSEEVLKQWQSHYGLSPNKTGVLMNSFNTKLFHAHADAADPCAGDTLKILFVGRFEYGKGTDYLARLHEELSLGEHDITITVCSPISVPDSTKRLYSRFKFLTELTPSEVAKEYNKADLFLLPSLYEAFELSSIEALGCGVPVLLNNTGSRPTLERLSCPSVFRLEEGTSPLGSILSAAKQFRGTSRLALSDWAVDNFGGNDLRDKLMVLCGFTGATL